jgi:hypothetical protein
MTKRGGVLQFRCKAEGCRESALISYDSKREAAELRARPYYIDYRCTRHSTPDKVLAPESGARQVVLVCAEETYGRFWRAEGETTGGNGFSFSEAHKAWAKDFPPGTRLYVTAYVVTPEQAALEAGVAR